MTKHSCVMDDTLKSVLEDNWEIDIEKSSQEKSIKILKIVTCLQLLETLNWFTSTQSHSHIIHAHLTQPHFIPEITPLLIKHWKAEITDQENITSQSRLNMLNLEQQSNIITALS